jgi:hypothetical protein
VRKGIRLATLLLGLACLTTACSHTPAPHSSSPTTTSRPHATTTSTVPPTTSLATTTTTTGAAPPTTVPFSIGPLVTRTQPGGLYSIALPASWVFADTSVPSDHQTNVWSDPADPNTTLTVVLSGCEGCVKASPTSTEPAPQNVLPAGATITQTIAPWQIYYSKPASPAGYTDFGTIEVTHNGSAVTGYDMLDLVAPSSGAASANQVLASFALG